MELIGKTINNCYKISEKTGEDFLSTLWKANTLSSNKQVAIKLLKHDNLFHRVEDIIRLKKKILSVSQIDHPNIVKIFEVDEYLAQPNNQQNHAGLESFTYIVTEPIDGVSLSDYIAEKKFVEQDDAQRIMNEIINGLQIAHQNEVIHRDLNPDNILIASKNGYIDQVKISGFGLVELKELSEINRLEDIVATFSYMSPEACGIVNKKIDERSDFYSLGVLFYQLLTGELPFTGDDINTIIHRHIAMMAPLPSEINNNIPHDLDRIIFKLLSKDKEERYQSAAGILADLEKVKRGEEDFILGTEDRRLKLNFKPRLIRREKELYFLKDLINKAYGSKGSICLIGGEAGSGKTSLVEELRGYIFKNDGVFLSGKCIAADNKIPYHVFHYSLNGYLNYYHQLDTLTQKKINEKAKASTGELGAIILSLNPSMIDILGEVPPLVELDHNKENERFLDVTSRFFCSLGKLNAPTVIFLDDLHLADEGSLSMLYKIAYNIKNSPLLIIGAYNDSEITRDHSLYKIKNELPDIHNIRLNIFDDADLKKLLSNIMGETIQRYPKDL